MKDLRYETPKYWLLKMPEFTPAEEELENLNSRGVYCFKSKIRYFGLSTQCLRYVRFHVYDERYRKIKTVSGNYLEHKMMSFGRAADLNFLIDIPNDIRTIKVEPVLESEYFVAWYYYILFLFGLATLCLSFFLAWISIF